MPLQARIGCSVFFFGVVAIIGGIGTSYEDYELAHDGIRTKGTINGFDTSIASTSQQRIIYEYSDKENNVRQKAVAVESGFQIPADRAIEIVYVADHPERAKPFELVTYKKGAILFV